MFAKSSGTFSSAGSITSFMAADQDLIYAITNNAIWKYNSSSRSYQQYLSGLVIAANSLIQSYNNSVITFSTTTNSATINIYSDNGNSLIAIPAIQLTGFNVLPKIVFSPRLSFVTVYGTTSSGSIIKLYYVDYAAGKTNELNFPTEAVFDPANLYISLEEAWLYVRQLKSSLQTTVGGNQEFSYAIQFNSILTRVKSQTITQFDEDNWVATHTSTSSLDNLNVYTQIRQSGDSAITVFNYEIVSPNTFGMSSKLSGNFVNGVLRLCTSGCKDCSSGSCTSCLSGYTLAWTSSLCLTCPTNCLTCSSSITNICLSCAPTFYL
jgi:hypothetical protein